VSAEDYASLSSLYGIMGEYAKAEAVAKKSLAVQEQRYGSSHLEFAKALQELSDIYSMQNRYPDEVLLTKRVIMIRERTAKDLTSRVEIVGSMNILVARYISFDRLDEAEALAKRSLAIVETDPELASINAAPNNSNLGQIYTARGNFKEAEKVYRRAVTLERKSPKMVNDYTADTFLGGISPLLPMCSSSWGGMTRLSVWQKRRSRSREWDAVPRTIR
jgi:tetratricopeptide (TPR) repeat protein